MHARQTRASRTARVLCSGICRLFSPNQDVARSLELAKICSFLWDFFLTKDGSASAFSCLSSPVSPFAEKFWKTKHEQEGSTVDLARDLVLELVRRDVLDHCARAQAISSSAVVRVGEHDGDELQARHDSRGCHGAARPGHIKLWRVKPCCSDCCPNF